MIGTLRRDARYALRRLRTTPTLSVVVVATLALGIGATSAVFTFLEGVILRSLPYAEPARLVYLWESSPKRDLPQFPVSTANLADWTARTRTLSGIAAATSRQFTLTGSGDPQRLLGAAVSVNYFDVLGATPALGRRFVVDDSTSAAGRAVILSYGAFNARFAGDRRVLGTSITLNGAPYQVVGVMGPGIPTKAELWVPLSVPPDYAADRQAHMLNVVARLRDGVTPEAASADLRRVADQLAAEYPTSNKDWTILAVPALDQLLGKTKPTLLALMAAVGLVLLIACANVANLLLARGSAREGEMAVRAALGAGRRALLRQMLVESAVLAAAGGVLGIVVARLGVSALRGLAPSTLPRLDQVALDGGVVGFAALVSVLTVLLFGLPPALQASRASLTNPLRALGRGGGRRAAAGRAQSALVLVQVAFAFALLSGAWLLLHSLDALRRVDLGMRPEQVVSAQLALPRAAFPRPNDQAQFASALVARLAAAPGVRHAAAVDAPPAGGGMPLLLLTVVGHPPADPSNPPAATVIAVTPGYFETLGVARLAGRDVRAGDDGAAPPVAVVDELFVRQFLGTSRDQALGQRVDLGDSTLRVIVGVVAHVRQAGPDSRDTPTMYLPFAQSPSSQLAVLVSTSAPLGSTTALVRREARQLGAGVPVYDVQTLGDRLALTIAPTRFVATVAGIFAALALALSAIGVYAMLSFVVAQQRRELGIRAALGAGRTTLLGRVASRGAALLLGGLAAGGVLSVVTSRAIRGLLFGVRPTDPLVVAGSVVVFLLVGTLASTIPAWRATRADPAIVLRED